MVFTFYVFNTTRLDKEYTIADLRGLPRRVEDFGLDDSFYGGRVAYVGETDNDVLLLIENRDGLQVIDTAATRLDNINIKHVREQLRRRKIAFASRAGKQELIDMLEGKGGGIIGKEKEFQEDAGEDAYA